MRKAHLVSEFASFGYLQLSPEPMKPFPLDESSRDANLKTNNASLCQIEIEICFFFKFLPLPVVHSTEKQVKRGFLCLILDRHD